jgi:hypothetical protein
MQPQALNKDATLADVLTTLVQPEAYLCAVLGNLSRCRMTHGNASVKIGITGQGKYPSHKVLYADAAGQEATYGAFDHDRPFTDVNIQVHTWSTAAMTFAEVQAILGEIRGFKQKRVAVN